MLAMTRKKKFRLGLLLLVVVLLLLLALPNMAIGQPPAIGMVCTEDTGTTSPVFDLQATDGYIQTPDGNSLYMWGYTLVGEPFQMPGPILCVNQGDIVTINLTNDLLEPVSIVFPGQSGVTASGGVPGLLAAEAAASGGTVSYTFTASHPGTYLYESGSGLIKQVQMGLYGVLVVRPALGPNYAYNDTNTAFDEEFLILMHEIDPNLHQAVERGEAYDVTTRHDRYWTINGRSMPDTLNDNFVPWLPNQPYSALVRVEAYDPAETVGTNALVRLVNAGTVNHPYHPHGNTMMIIGRDGRLLEQPAGLQLENFTTTIGAGQTYDLIFRWDDVEGFEDPAYPVPVQLPGITDLVFKDGVTFYSGDPYLGQRGDLPVGVTSYNQCGEFYFPWHSHALNEFQNFDEGFGGLATLVRVDPPSGCP